MSNPTYGKLYLIPNFLSEDNQDDFLPEMVRRMAHNLQNFVVENEKEARALIKRLRLSHAQPELRFWLLNEHTQPVEIPQLLAALNGQDAGIISDAGLPCVADPGSALVSLAHTKGIEIIPLPGASSLMMALMGSGFSGQQFAFSGYLPIDMAQRLKRIRELEKLALQGQTQIFMETPYRNRQLLDDLLAAASPETKLCIACNMSSDKGWVKTLRLKEWKNKTPEFHKIPSVFVIGA